MERQRQAGFSFVRGLDYPRVLAASERVAWIVDGVFTGRRFDPTRPLVPDSWLGVEALPFLDAEQRLVLGQCRAFSYVHLLGNFEEFAPPHVGDLVQWDWHDERARLRGLLRFADEEMKHQQLFARAERVLEESCGYAFARHFDAGKRAVTELTSAILAHPPLARFLLVLALEWGTQRHYAESIRDHAQSGGDALYVDLLRAHWVEEAQHVKWDMLEVAALASVMTATELAAALDDVAVLGGVVQPAFDGQAACEVDTLEAVTGRKLTSAQRALLRATLSRSLVGILAGIGLSHPSFARLACELSPAGAARLGIGCPPGGHA